MGSINYCYNRPTNPESTRRQWSKRSSPWARREGISTISTFFSGITPITGKFGAARIVDPRPFAAGTLKEVFEHYPHIGRVLPAMGYTEAQVKDLATTINNTPADLVLFSTPIHLCLLLNCDKPNLRVRYEYQDYGKPTLEEVLVKRMGAGARF
jgi:hypothetical protein